MTDQPMPPRRRPAGQPQNPPPRQGGPRQQFPPGPMPRMAPGGPAPRGPRPNAYQPPQAWSEQPNVQRSPRPASTRPAQPDVRAQGPGVSRYAPTQRPEPVPGGPRREPSPRPPSNGNGPHGPGGNGPNRGRQSAAPAPAPGKPARTKRRRRFPFGKIALVLVVLLVGTSVGAVFYYDHKLHRVSALSDYAGRVADTPGTNWLIVGTDSRADLSQAQKNELATGDSDGSRTDTIMLVHKPTSGKAMIISIPRDLYVPIPGQGSHKINSAFNFGGPHLLVQTVETLSGVHIDHFGEIGFGGFDTLVDAIGGVHICITQALNDPKAGLRLSAGCHDLNGQQALGLVRTRAFPNADLERVVNQRKFLSALMSKAISPGVLLNPFKLFPFINGAIDALTVDQNDHIWDLMSLAWALHSDPITTTLPTGGPVSTDDGDSLAVGTKTKQFFAALAAGHGVDNDLISDQSGVVK